MSELNQTKINLYDLLICLTNAGDLIRPEVSKHHQQVAYLAFRIADQMKLSAEQKKELMLAGLTHDVGAFSLDERLSLIEEEPPTSQDHAFRGARLLEGFSPLAGAAGIIRYHHIPWSNGEGRTFRGEEVSPLSHILHLADRAAVAVDRKTDVIGQIKNIQGRILKLRNSVFMPEAADAFLEISEQEYIWLDMVYEPLLYILPDIVVFDTVELDLDELTELTKIFANIIDFRNPFTATHSSGVAAAAEKLAELAGFSKNECKMMQSAGHLHDLGKLAVSRSILEKPGALDADELNRIRSHTFYTYRLLQAIRGFETINQWASFHHERLSGNGYPFHLGENSLSLGSRIMAVADIFTAIMEDRPYRKGMAPEQAVAVLNTMVLEKAICPYVVSILMENFDAVDNARRRAQSTSSGRYDYVMNAPL
ncbi:HD domain-containing phosphohydrolase [Papillibacter cinnamivorans]|uniref:HD-GYP domain n=1 Tax=Papillibacter cinnamivorans DSM 12816 TaxID=1122930 RepID=A0A1W2AXN7_9FIRM|nr:HD domain-containing phosphohydrolase [Papillibacter cinnamivorans]SMC65485.1 HD-GYP domain [Papillibacter cinnamivorans DSM 12816]